MRYPNFVSESYVSQSPTASAQQLINYYLQKNIPGAKNEIVYYPTPGFAVFAALDDSPVRAEFAEMGRCWAVSGAHAYEVYADGTSFKFPLALDTDQYPATISSNGASQLFVTSGGSRYLIDTLANTLVKVTGHSTMGASLNGYFLSFDITTGKCEISTIFNGLVWDAALFQLRSLAPDPWRSMQVVNGRIYFLGEKTTELWGNSGTFPFPFAPLTTTLIMYGIVAPFAAGHLGDTLAWAANTDGGAGLIVKTRGIAVQEIQTEPVAYALSRFTTIADMRVWGYEDQAHQFFNFDFPSGNATYTFDDGPLATWHTRGLWNSALSSYGAWGPTCHAYAFGKHLVGDRASGTIYHMDIALGLDFGAVPLRRLIQPPALFDQNKPLFIGPIELYMETGLGLPLGAPAAPVVVGSDPQVLMRFSRNGGKKWGSARTRSAGEQGEFNARVIWARNPSGRSPVPQFVFSDPVPWRIVDCFVDVTRSRGATQAAA